MNLTIPYPGLAQRITSVATITSDLGESVTVSALWDTGAMYSMITEDVAQKLGLEYIGYIEYTHAAGVALSNVYVAAIEIEGGMKIDRIELMTSTHAPGMLIGMDIITRGDFRVRNKNGKTVFTFSS